MFELLEFAAEGLDIKERILGFNIFLCAWLVPLMMDLGGLDGSRCVDLGIFSGFSTGG